MAIYMNYDGLKVKGDVTESGHKNWIELNSFQWGIGRGISSPVGASADRESSAPSVSEVTITKVQDVATVGLLQEALQGDGVTVKIEFTRTQKDKQDVYCTYELTNTMISGFSTSSGGDRPTESLSLNFTKVLFKGGQLDAAGKASTSATVIYDLSEAKTG